MSPKLPAFPDQPRIDDLQALIDDADRLIALKDEEIEQITRKMGRLDEELGELEAVRRVFLCEQGGTHAMESRHEDRFIFCPNCGEQEKDERVPSDAGVGDEPLMSFEEGQPSRAPNHHLRAT